MASTLTATHNLNAPKPKPLQIHFEDAKVDAMLSLLKLSPFPTDSKPPLPLSSAATAISNKWERGVDVEWIAGVKERFERKFGDGDGEGEGKRGLEERVNRWGNWVVRMVESVDGESEGEGGKKTVTEVELDVHFVHAVSERKGAIPLLMLHGWPGTFLDFHKVIEPLVNPPEGKQAFHVITPSLPGYFKSSLPQYEGWTLVHTARVMHRLMVEVLGYERYAVQGGDWGGGITRIIGTNFASYAPVVHFNMFPRKNGLGAVAGEEEKGEKAELTANERQQLAQFKEFTTTGHAYSQIHATKPFTIGLAIAASPLSLLIWIGEKFYGWSDPRYLDVDDLIDTVALYWLSGCFASSVVIYSQKTFGPQGGEMKSKVGYTSFPYEIIGASRAQIAAECSLVFYKEKEKGGHFAALDNPEGLVEDLREFFGEYFPKA